jgi:hypothetical protein
MPKCYAVRMRAIFGIIVVLAACTDQDTPEPTEPIAVALTTTDVRVVSVPVGIDCGNEHTACVNTFQFFSNQLQFETATITLVVVEHPASCRIFSFKYADSSVGGCRTTQLTCGFSAAPGDGMNIDVSCQDSP